MVPPPVRRWVSPPERAPTVEMVIIVVVLALVTWRVLWMKVLVRLGIDDVLDVVLRVCLVERWQVGAALAPLPRRNQLQIDLRSGARAMR